jgi:hypothetical protein
MSGRQLTTSEYVQPQFTILSGELLIELEDTPLTHTKQVVLRFCQVENVHYQVVLYLNTGASRFEELAQEWLYDRQV